MPDEIRTEKPLPVLIGEDYKHVMGHAVIVQTPDSVVITIEATGKSGRALGDYVAASEIVALSFSGVPVRHHIEEKKF
jgi:hypothetical protein